MSESHQEDHRGPYRVLPEVVVDVAIACLLHLASPRGVAFEDLKGRTGIRTACERAHQADESQAPLLRKIHFQ